MGKPTGKKKLQAGVDKVVKQNKSASSDRTSKQIDEDTAVFIRMSQEIKEEGNKLFQKLDNEGAMLKYEKALKLLPKNHIDVAYLHSKMVDCYMQLGLKEYPRAIQECNLALEVAPKYSKALLRRAKCYEALNKFDWALRDVKNVLSMEPNNMTALEIEDSVNKAIEGKGLKVEDIDVNIESNSLEAGKVLKEKVKKKKSNSFENKKVEEIKDINVEKVKASKVKRVKERRGNRLEKKLDEKVVLEDRTSIKEEKVVMRTVKLVLGDDIRRAQLPVDCSIGFVREIVRDQFPGLDGVLIKFKDLEGDLVTIITTAELRLAEASSDPQGSFRLYLAEVGPDKEPFYEGLKSEGISKADSIISSVSENAHVEKKKGSGEGHDLCRGMDCPVCKAFQEPCGI